MMGIFICFIHRIARNGLKTIMHCYLTIEVYKYQNNFKLSVCFTYPYLTRLNSVVHNSDSDHLLVKKNTMFLHVIQLGRYIADYMINNGDSICM